MDSEQNAFHGGLILALILCGLFQLLLYNYVKTGNRLIVKAQDVCKGVGAELEYYYWDDDFSCTNGASFSYDKLRENRE